MIRPLTRIIFLFAKLYILIGISIASRFTQKSQEIIETYEEFQKISEGILESLRSSSRKEYQFVLQQFERWINQPKVGHLFNQVGNIYSLQGRYQSAIELYKKAEYIFHHSGDRLGEADVWHNQGNVLFYLGQYKQARNCYNHAKNVWSNLNDNYLQAHSLKNLGTTNLSLGQLSLEQLEQVREYYEQAKKFYNQALNIFHSLCKQLDEAITISEIGLVDCFLGESEQGIEKIKNSLHSQSQQRNRNPVGDFISLNYLGVAYLFLGQYQQAIDYLQQSLTILQDIKSPAGEAFALGNIGLAFFKQGNLLEAEKTLENSIEMREKLRSRLNDINKVSFFDVQIDAYSILQQVLIQQEKPEAALEISERGRARAFADLLATRLSSPSNEQLTIIPPTIKQIKQISQEQNATIVEYSIIYDWVVDRGVRCHRESKLFIWVIKPTGEIVFRLNDIGYFLKQTNNTSMEEIVRKSRASIGIDENVKNFEPPFQLNKNWLYPHLHQLYQILIQPIAEFLPDNPDATLIFIPQGSLFLVPFPSLQDEKGNFLIQKHTLITAPSIQVMDLTNQQNKAKVETSINALIVGNPQMPSLEEVSGEPFQELQPLPASEVEALAIASLLSVKAIIGDKATKVDLVQQMPSSRLIHLATHGILREFGQPGIPGAIALAATSDDKGFLTASNIMEMFGQPGKPSLQAELLVLSACQTGLGNITGDGVIGLSRSIIAAGVPRVIVSLWGVSDLSTAFLMSKFYTILKELTQLQPGDAAKALKQAQQCLRNLTIEEFELKQEFYFSHMHY